MQLNKKKYFCNNCGSEGHVFSKCNEPITSLGVIAYRFNTDKNEYQFILIKRKDSLGFVDFMRGKYDLYNVIYLRNIFDEMTLQEKQMILHKSFDELWEHMWKYRNISMRYKNEYNTSYKKYNKLKHGFTIRKQTISLETLIQTSPTTWKDAEWEFPKGRRNYKESDYTSALREFQEETGIDCHELQVVMNIKPMDEVFIGSNFKCYKSRYFLCHIPYNTSLSFKKQDCEVSSIGWYSFNEINELLRTTQSNKKDIIRNIYILLHDYTISPIQTIFDHK